MCQEETTCNYMDNLRATTSGKDEDMESDKSSLWAGEGTSDALSSEEEKEPTTEVCKSGRRMTGKQKPSSVKSPGGLSGESQGASVASASGSTTVSQKMKVLVVGDSNALGICETKEPELSLRQALSVHYDITVVAKDKSGWGDPFTRCA